mgnify:CR=1 FL=1
MVIHPYTKIWYAYVKEQRWSCQVKIHDEDVFYFYIEVKGRQAHTEVMNVREQSYHCDTLINKP